MCLCTRYTVMLWCKIVQIIIPGKSTMVVNINQVEKKLNKKTVSCEEMLRVFDDKAKYCTVMSIAPPPSLHL